ncbi:MAG: FtsW/RodA/SpoVE family cell cycle protein [Clostridium fessum]
MTALICVLPVGMVYLQPNLSTTIVICFMILCMIYVAGISYKWIAGAVAVEVPGFCGAYLSVVAGIYPVSPEILQAQRIHGKDFPQQQ